jgi:hypothetical protein
LFPRKHIRRSRDGGVTHALQWREAGDLPGVVESGTRLTKIGTVYVSWIQREMTLTLLA